VDGRGKSDSPIIPGKPPNKGRGAPRLAEAVEERGLAKGNPVRHDRDRAQDRVALQSALDRVRQAASNDRELRFTTLWHHVYDIRRLREAYFSMKRDAAAGVDGQTWRQYGEALESHLEDLSDRLRRGGYRAKPVRRAFIPKADGGQRPLGVPVLEDKIVQRATAEVLNAIYETDFVGFSYGFRPGRSPHNALDAVSVGITRRKVSWVLDADIRGFYDAVDHEWLVKFVEHRIADRRVVRHVKKWLKAGVMEDGERRRVEEGTPQGSSVSPILSNLYLHHVFDLWAQRWRQKHARGEMIVVRFADDIIAGFQYKSDAERFWADMRERFHTFRLELHPDKTRLIEFGRFAAQARERRGQGKPETFDFLGFTHICAKKRNGKFVVLRQTMKKRLRAKVKAVKTELRIRLHDPVPEVGRWLASVVRGHAQYYGVPRNSRAINLFRHQVIGLWYRSLRRRSQKTRLTWSRMYRLARRWIPYVRISHPYPEQRLCV
jgi:group II intron reverse transcriptase/maturase